MRKTLFKSISTFSLWALMLICFVFKLPSNLFCNILRGFFVVLGVISYLVFCYFRSVESKIENFVEDEYLGGNNSDDEKKF